jgi:hypothetical protein
MSRAASTFRQSDLLTTRDVIRLLRRTSGWFYANREELERQGFPTPIPIVGHYDAKAVNAWLDRQSGRTEQSPPQDRIMRRIEQWGKSA